MCLRRGSCKTYVVVASHGVILGLLLPSSSEAQTLVVVGHTFGFKKANGTNSALKREITEMGGSVLQSTMPFHNDAIRTKANTSIETLIADTLRMMGQGTKVCVEIVAMACDNGLIESGKNVLAIAGTGKGADTILVIKSANSRRFFDLK